MHDDSVDAAYRYDADFYTYTSRLSSPSARRIAAIFQELLPVRSVLDVGCGTGVWLGAWHGVGVEDVFGIDGDYVDRDRLGIPSERFLARDLNLPFRLGRHFDLVQSLEVAEHLPAARAASFIEDLAAHADMVLFSAAPPGQGGENHINEQPYDYWRAFFRRAGLVPLDCVRPMIAGQTDVAPWYRYNVLLYVHERMMATLPESLLRHLVPEDLPIPDLSPPVYRLRKAVINRMPMWACQLLARMRARLR